jgi:hypothetical protein
MGGPHARTRGADVKSGRGCPNKDTTFCNDTPDTTSHAAAVAAAPSARTNIVAKHDTTRRAARYQRQALQVIGGGCSAFVSNQIRRSNKHDVRSRTM